MKSVIFDVRGTNGAGKTTLVRSFIDPENFVELIPGVDGTLSTDGKIVALGRYDNRAACGGCDRIKTQRQIRSAVEAAAQVYPFVFLEGVIVSTIYGPYLELSRRLKDRGHSYIWTFLNTPLRTCIQRILERNGGKAFKRRLVYDKHQGIARVREKAIEAGEIVIDIASDSEEIQTWIDNIRTRKRKQ